MPGGQPPPPLASPQLFEAAVLSAASLGGGGLSAMQNISRLALALAYSPVLQRPPPSPL